MEKMEGGKERGVAESKGRSRLCPPLQKFLRVPTKANVTYIVMFA